MIIAILKFLFISLWAGIVVSASVSAGVKRAYKELLEEKEKKE